jgi:hypothetical protein
MMLVIASELVHEVVDLKTPPSMVVNSFTEAQIEVVRSIEEAENEVHKAESALDEGESIRKEVGETLSGTNPISSNPHKLP